MKTASRLKLDFALSEGVTFTGAEIDESNANLKGFRVLQVNAGPAAIETSLAIDEVAEAVAGQPVELTATVDPADAAGTVEFSSGEHSTGPVEIVDGTATGELTFPEAGDYEVTASFTPANAEAHTASSATRTVTVAGRSANLAVTPAESAPARGHVEATATVEPGATGTVAFRIGEGAEVTADVVDGTGFNNNPVVPRVNASGAPDANGEFARIWDGGHSVNNGGNENDNWGPFTSRAGLQVDQHKQWRFPQIAFDVTAPDTAGATIVTGLRGTGTGAGPASRDNRDNTMSMLARANATDAVYCSAAAAGRTLTTTQVVARGTETNFAETSTDLEVVTGSGPTTLTFRAMVSDMETDTQELTGAEAATDVDVAPVSRTSISVELEDDGVLVGRRTTITAKYSATPSIPEGTEVIFRADGVRIGTATVGADGVATIEHSFDAAGPKRITALVEKREVDGRVYPRAESEAAVLTVAAPAGQDTTTDLTYTRPDVDVEAEVLTGDLIRFIATVDAGDSAIEEGATVSFFDGDTFLGTAPVDPATGQAVFDHRFAERGEHQIRAVFNGQEKKDGEGVITEVLEPSESDPVTLDVREHDVVIEEPGDNPGDEPGDGVQQRAGRQPGRRVRATAPAPGAPPAPAPAASSPR